MKQWVRFFLLSAGVASFVFGMKMESPWAANFTSTDAADFQADLTAAATNDTDDVITLIGGTFSTAGNGDTRFDYISTKNNKLTIQGAGAGVTFLETNPLSPTTLLNIDVGGTGANADVFVEGITFLNGEDQGLIFAGNTSDLEVKDCDFIGNNIALMFLPVSGSVKVSGSLFQDSETGALNQMGGSTGTVTYTDNVFQGNQTGLLVSGGATINLEKNKFLGNTSLGSGAGMLIAGPFDAHLRDNLFLDNSSPGPGGAVFVPVSNSLEMVGNIFSRNFAGAGGGAVSAGYSVSGLFTNNTLTNNSSGATTPAGMQLTPGNTNVPTSFFNNIIFGNPAVAARDISFNDAFGSAGSPILLSHNDIGTFTSICRDDPACTENITEVENISEPPLFVNAAGDDFHLAAGSPCIASGDPAALGLPALDFEGSPLNNPPEMGALAAVVTNIAVDRSEIEFGEISLDLPNTQNLTITNNGAAVLNVTGMALSDTANFAVEPGDCGGLAFSLASAESCTAQVTFKPGTESPLSATLTLSSNDPDEGSLVVGLSGTGVETGGGGGSGGGGGCALNDSSGKGFYAHFFLISLGLLGLRLRRRQLE